MVYQAEIAQQQARMQNEELKKAIIAGVSTGQIGTQTSANTTDASTQAMVAGVAPGAIPANGSTAAAVAFTPGGSSMMTPPDERGVQASPFPEPLDERGVQVPTPGTAEMSTQVPGFPMTRKVKDSGMETKEEVRPARRGGDRLGKRPHRVADSSDPDSLPPQIERDLGHREDIIRSREQSRTARDLRAHFDAIDAQKRANQERMRQGQRSALPEGHDDRGWRIFKEI